VSERFLGLPLVAWGVICLAVAAVWAVVWPADRAAGAVGLRFFIARWGHAIVWALLAAMCFMKASGNRALEAWSNPVGLAALLVYLSFLAAAFVLR